MTNNIRYTERPYLPHEHPSLKDYIISTKQNINKIIKLYRNRTNFTVKDQQIKQLFNDENYDLQTGVNHLTNYFLDSFLAYSDHTFSKVYYPGIPSEQGVESDAIESAARIYPLLASYLRANISNGGHSRYQQIKNALHQGFLNATNINSKGYWGELSDYRQTICETADLSLSLWLTKEIIWQNYSAQEKQQIIQWLKQINHVQTVDNNWHLFVLLTQLVIKNLSGEDYICYERYQRITEFYVGEGWFRDGAKGNFDYYNSWGFHYGLFWLDQIDPTFDRTFIHQAATQFSTKFKLLFTPKGFAFFGRSIMYRLAAPCALISQMIQQQQANGEVKRIVATLLRFFILHGSIQHGTLTQGLFTQDRRLVDSYSGSGSALWSLRSIILLLYGAEAINFWQTEEQPLQIEKNDFTVEIEAINLKIIGHQQTQEVIALFKQNQYPDYPFTQAALQSQPRWQIYLEKFVGRAIRPKNNLIRKGVTTYSSKLNLFLPPK